MFIFVSVAGCDFFQWEIEASREDTNLEMFKGFTPDACFDFVGFIVDLDKCIWENLQGWN